MGFFWHFPRLDCTRTLKQDASDQLSSCSITKLQLRKKSGFLLSFYCSYRWPPAECRRSSIGRFKLSAASKTSTSQLRQHALLPVILWALEWLSIDPCSLFTLLSKHTQVPPNPALVREVRPHMQYTSTSLLTLLLSSLSHQSSEFICECGVYCR